MDAETVEQIRKLRNSIARSLIALIACIAVTTIAALVTILRGSGHDGQVLALTGVVDLAAITAAAVINARVWRRYTQLAAAGQSRN